MDYPPVLTKKDFLRRFANNEFGNRGPLWNTLDEWKESGYGGLVHLRNRVAGGDTFYNIPADRVEHCWSQVHGRELITPTRGGPLYQTRSGSYYLAAMAPHSKNLIQGEVQRSHTGLELFYSTEIGLPMRDALGSTGRRAYGIISNSLLRGLMCPNSWEWLNALLDRYDGHVIEFSTFDCEWGTVEGFNTVYWECRLY